MKIGTLLFGGIFLALSLAATELPTKNFTRIPANPEFSFARNLDGMSSRSTGEKSGILKPYFLARYPVTNAEYAEFVSATGHCPPRYWRNGTYPVGKANHPVLEVTYDDALAYCVWFGEKFPGWKFRLPTEAEWENAAAGPKHFSFPWGNDSEIEMRNSSLVAKFNFNGVVAAEYLKKSPNLSLTFIHAKASRKDQKILLKNLISVDAKGRVRGWIDHQTYTGFVYTDLFRTLSLQGGCTTPVDHFPEGKSPYGCFDMAGNSWDWTSSDIVASNGAERGKTVKAVRGGSWYSMLNSCRTSYRGEGRKATGAYSTVGFRLAAEPQEK